MDLRESIGSTPIVRLNHITKFQHSEILVKIEFRNPGGYIKDRPALQMIEGALQNGRLRSGGTIVENLPAAMRV